MLRSYQWKFVLGKKYAFDSYYCRIGFVVERSPRMREIGIRSPVATDPLLKQVMTALLPRAWQQVLYLQFTCILQTSRHYSLCNYISDTFGKVFDNYAIVFISKEFSVFIQSEFDCQHGLVGGHEYTLTGAVLVSIGIVMCSDITKLKFRVMCTCNVSRVQQLEQ